VMARLTRMGPGGVCPRLHIGVCRLTLAPDLRCGSRIWRANCRFPVSDTRILGRSVQISETGHNRANRLNDCRARSCDLALEQRPDAHVGPSASLLGETPPTDLCPGAAVPLQGVPASARRQNAAPGGSQWHAGISSRGWG
jgi:hypothetical protein